MQTVLLEVPTILKNRPLTYYFEDDSEAGLTPNHSWFARQKILLNPVLTANLNVHSRKTNNILIDYWNRWKKKVSENHSATNIIERCCNCEEEGQFRPM